MHNIFQILTAEKLKMNIVNLYKKIFEVWFDEYHENTRFGLKGRLIIEEKTNFQTIKIIQSKRYGRALILDNCWMTAENQEKQYHESLIHPALTSAERISKILIIGGGDGGAARECLLYPEVQKVDLVEIDNRVIELSKEYLPSIGGNAWKDHRLHIHVENGINWAKKMQDDSYDVVIVDSSDPQGPAKGLFNKQFFLNCHRILRKGGVFATQTESPESFLDIHVQTVQIIREVFEFADPLYGNVPIYPGGLWSWTFGAKDKARYYEPISERTENISKTCEIWSRKWQHGAFNLIPASLEKKLNQ